MKRFISLAGFAAVVVGASMSSGQLPRASGAKSGAGRQREYAKIAKRMLAGRPAVADRKRSRALPSTGFTVKSSAGFTLYVNGIPPGGDGPFPVIAVEAWRQGALALYEFPGTVSNHHLVSSLGGFGNLDMTFAASGQTRKYTPGGCVHGSFRVRDGSWSGEFEFTGEGGYTSSTSTSGSPTWLYSHSLYAGFDRCESSASGTGVHGVALNAYSRIGFLTAYQNKGPGTRANFDAIEFEAPHSMRVTREVWTAATPGTFTYGPSLGHARIRPPAPFAGSADFRSGSHRGEGHLRGNLSADFPGANAMPLLPTPAEAQLDHEAIRLTH